MGWQRDLKCRTSTRKIWQETHKCLFLTFRTGMNQGGHWLVPCRPLHLSAILLSKFNCKWPLRDLWLTQKGFPFPFFPFDLCGW